MRAAVLLLVFCVCSLPCFAYKVLLVDNEYTYEVYEPEDPIPLATIDEALVMYTEAYFTPSLHDGISLDVLKIDTSRYSSYDDFIKDMFNCDFYGYEDPTGLQRHFYQIRYHDQIVSVCAVLSETVPGFYYADHIATHTDFRRKGLVSKLIKLVKETLPSFHQLSLDTRVFNTPAQALYEKLGFSKFAIHPNPYKQATYFHYVLK